MSRRDRTPVTTHATFEVEPMRAHATLGGLGAVLLSLAACAAPGGEPTDRAPSDDGPAALGVATRRWFVELPEPPLTRGGSIARQLDEVARFHADAAAIGLDLVERYRFASIVHGVTVEIRPEQLARLGAVPGVVRIYPVGLSEMPVVSPVAEPQLASALSMTGADVVQSELGFDGSGIKIGIIDTGVDREHGDLAAHIVGGFDFVGDAYDGGDPASVPVPEPGEGSRPGGDDCGGHGTHVAGIAAGHGDPATGGARGVAPGASIGAYRVFGCDGSTADDVIVAAIERAYEDGMDVINLSLGSNNGWPDDFLSLALSRVLDLGMVPVASAGNNGRSGVYTVGSPGAGAEVIAVASYDNLFTLAKKLVVSDGTEVAYGVLTGAPTPPTSGVTPPLVHVGQGCLADPYLASPAGQVALITRGTCSFAEKYERAFAEGALGVVIENNAPGGFSGTLGGTFDLGFAVSISQEAGAAIRALIDVGGAPTITWTDGSVAEPNPSGDLISAFSSYGLTPDLAFKPDVAAPGGLIRSTWPLDAEGSDGYAVLSGTSMSAPHVTGAVALLLQARPDLTPDQVRTALQNTAQPKPSSADPDGGILEAAHRQGAGMIRIDAAIESRTFVSPGRLALGESQLGAATRVLVIENRGPQPVTYRLGNVGAMATTGSSDAPTTVPATATVSFDGPGGATELVTVPAGGFRPISVTIEAPADLADLSVYGGFLTITPEGDAGGALAATVPYAGFKGDYQRLPSISIDPALSGLDAAGEAVAVAEGTAYSMSGIDFPAFSIGFAHGAERVTAEIIPLGQNAWLGPQRAFSLDRVRRDNPGQLSVFGVESFDGSFLPDGSYRVRLTLLKAGGDPTHPDHVEAVETPLFRIDRSP